MILLSEFLNVNLRQAKRKNYANYLEYIVRTNRLSSNELLISYLEKYSLYSSKYLNYKDWKKVAYIIDKKLHKTIEGKDEIRLIRDGMNSKRTAFN
jgi:hypothetical protein